MSSVEEVDDPRSDRLRSGETGGFAIAIARRPEPCFVRRARRRHAAVEPAQQLTFGGVIAASRHFASRLAWFRATRDDRRGQLENAYARRPRQRTSLYRFREVLADDLAKDPERHRKMDAELFAFIDQLAEQRETSIAAAAVPTSGEQNPTPDATTPPSPTAPTPVPTATTPIVTPES